MFTLRCVICVWMMFHCYKTLWQASFRVVSCSHKACVWCLFLDRTQFLSLRKEEKMFPPSYTSICYLHTYLLIIALMSIVLSVLLFDFIKPSAFHTLLQCMRVGTLIVATIYLQLIQNRYMFRSFTVLQCSRQHRVQPVASDVEVVGYLQQRLLC